MMGSRAVVLFDETIGDGTDGQTNEHPCTRVFG